MITRLLLACLAFLHLTAAHIVITYPGWRGDNLATNGTVGVDDNSDDKFPYGMQWAYPCGGIPLGSNPNRTYWPIGGGAVAFQPGWFQGHKTALLYINLGMGNAPINYSLIMQPQFQITGPTNDAYPGLPVCFPQVPTPANLTVNEGDNATIQVVENAKHGAALYSCVDITFTNNMSKVQNVNEDNCYNHSAIQLGSVFSTLDLASQPASSAAALHASAAFGVMLAAVVASVTWVGL